MYVCVCVCVCTFPHVPRPVRSAFWGTGRGLYVFGRWEREFLRGWERLQGRKGFRRVGYVQHVHGVRLGVRGAGACGARGTSPVLRDGSTEEEEEGFVLEDLEIIFFSRSKGIVRCERRLGGGKTQSFGS